MGLIAGPNVVRIINEPTAVIAYGLDRGLQGGLNILVLTLVGGRLILAADD